MEPILNVTPTPQGMIITAVRKIGVVKLMAVARSISKTRNGHDVYITTYHFHDGRWEMVLPEHHSEVMNQTEIVDRLNKFFQDTVDFLDS